MEKILYHAGPDRGRAKQLSELTRLLGMEFVEIGPVQSGQQLGYLAGVEGFLERKPSVLEQPRRIPEEMLVFCGITGEKLDQVLHMLKSSGLQISLKAVLTVHNVGWTPTELYQELQAERAQFQKKE